MKNVEKLTQRLDHSVPDFIITDASEAETAQAKSDATRVAKLTQRLDHMVPDYGTP